MGVSITSLFKWEAVAAVGAVLTLVQAVYLASQSSRRSASRDRLLLQYICRELIAVRIIAQVVNKVVSDGRDPKLVFERSSDIIEDKLFGVSRINLPNINSLDAIDAYENAMSTVRGLIDGVDSDGVSRFLLPHQIEYLSYSIEMLKRDIDDLDGFFFSRIIKNLRRGPAPEKPKGPLAQAVERQAGDIGSKGK